MKLLFCYILVSDFNTSWNLGDCGILWSNMFLKYLDQSIDSFYTVFYVTVQKGPITTEKHFHFCHNMTASEVFWEYWRLFYIVFAKRYLFLASHKFYLELPIASSQEGNIILFLILVFFRQASRNVYVRTVTGSTHSRCWPRREKLWSSWNWPLKMKNSLKHRRRSKRLESWQYEYKFGWGSYDCVVWDLLKEHCFFGRRGAQDWTFSFVNRW